MAQGLIDNEDNVTVMAPISYEDFSLLGFPVQTNFISLGNVFIHHNQRVKQLNSLVEFRVC